MQAGTNLVCYQRPLPISWCMCSGRFSNLRFVLLIGGRKAKSCKMDRWGFLDSVVYLNYDLSFKRKQWSRHCTNSTYVPFPANKQYEYFFFLLLSIFLFLFGSFICRRMMLGTCRGMMSSKLFFFFFLIMGVSIIFFSHYLLSFQIFANLILFKLLFRSSKT